MDGDLRGEPMLSQAESKLFLVISHHNPLRASSTQVIENLQESGREVSLGSAIDSPCLFKSLFSS